MVDGWESGDVVALAGVAVALISVVVSIVVNAKTFRRALRDRHLGERAQAYADFLVTQDARFDAYDRTRAELGPDPARWDSEPSKVDECRQDIARQRVAAWGVQARLQLLAPEPVLAAAEKYADAITAANPLRRLPGRGEPYVGLANDKKGELKDAFVHAARTDLDPRE